MLAKFDVKEKKIGEHTYYVRPFPPFPSTALLGDIQAVITTAMKDSTSGVNTSTQDLLDAQVNLGNLIAGLGQNLNGEVLVKFSHRLLDSDYVSVKFKNTAGETETVRLTEEVINQLFTANLTEMLKLLYFIIEVNYGDFFALVPNLSGFLGSMARK